MSKFAHVIAAVEARAKHQDDVEGRDLWAIGAAVIRDCGRSNDGAHIKGKGAGSHDGSLAKIQAAARELESRGYDAYSAEYLRQVRDTATMFPANRRHADLNFFIHTEAGNPDILDWIVKHAPKKQELSGRYVREMVGVWLKRHTAETKQKHEQATFKKRKAQADHARARKAGDTSAAERAEREAAAAEREMEETESLPTKRDLPPPDKSDSIGMVRELQALGAARDAVKLAKEIQKLADEASRSIARVIADMDERAASLLHEEWMKAAEACTDANKNCREAAKTADAAIRDKRHGRLAVVNE